MNSLFRIIRPPRCFIQRTFSSSIDHSKFAHNVDPAELLSDEEIEFEVKLLIRKKSKVHLLINNFL